MSEFTTDLKIKPVGCGRWELLEAFDYYTDDGRTVEVPVGFTTDFASIPRLVWPIYPPYGDTWGKAAVVHDYLYATQPDWCSRKRADQEFLCGMKVLGCPWTRRTVMYQMVRWFAGGAWKHHAERLAKAKLVIERLNADREG